MRRALIICCLFVVAVGCDKKAVAESQESWNHISKAAVIEWGALSKQLANLDMSAPKAQWEAAKQKLIEAQKSLQGTPATQENEKKKGEVSKQIDAVNKGMAAQNLREQYQQIVDGAKKAGETADQTKKRLEQTNDQFKEVQDRYLEAQKQWEDAKKWLQDKVNGK